MAQKNLFSRHRAQVNFISKIIKPYQTTFYQQTNASISQSVKQVKCHRLNKADIAARVCKWSLQILIVYVGFIVQFQIHIFFLFFNTKQILFSSFLAIRTIALFDSIRLQQSQYALLSAGSSEQQSKNFQSMLFSIGRDHDEQSLPHSRLLRLNDSLVLFPHVLCVDTVSYTHLTLPTICSVQISVVAVSFKKKKDKGTEGTNGMTKGMPDAQQRRACE
eukprot:TRINITY_DN6066_c0_g1_i2.p1 TRINITY_DN6066_c0_g1~~TRINITY_DN6066_c0_g1_i2.p1  ORF type:complete len:219 (-),score=12.03 TRINITY_DN6066_c0_g1_i2:28-684(-)